MERKYSIGFVNKDDTCGTIYLYARTWKEAYRKARDLEKHDSDFIADGSKVWTVKLVKPITRACE